jgi:hypothetical protein
MLPRSSVSAEPRWNWMRGEPREILLFVKPPDRSHRNRPLERETLALGVLYPGVVNAGVLNGVPFCTFHGTVHVRICRGTGMAYATSAVPHQRNTIIFRPGVTRLPNRSLAR